MTTCQRVDAKGKICDGTIEEGICGTCGRPAQKGTLIAASTTTAMATQARGGVTGTTGTARTGSGRVSRRQASGGTTSRRQSLGGGLVSLPPVPSQDPQKLVMANPEVPLSKRNCPNCGARVNRVKGFCPQCSEAYDFEPRLKPGTVVAGKYEIKGPIGLGGMGWIYLATDLVLKRWVVFKGVLNARDADAAAAAVAERQFLAAVKHPKIVSIYDFVSHGAEGFMVLEYVGGRTLDEIRADHDLVDLVAPDGSVAQRGLVRKDLQPGDLRSTLGDLTTRVTRFGVLPPEQAIAYILGIMPAFSYLHAQGFTHNDMKPDNVMVEGGDVKLLDLGAMRRIDDSEGLVFGTEGFFAPEASENPIAVSDLYALGRSLAILLIDFLYKTRVDKDQTTGRVTTRRLIVSSYKTAIPLPDDAPVLKQNDSLYRFLLRATHEDPDQRFQSAEEMEGQLFGILREIVALKTGPKPAESRVFFGDGLVGGSDGLATDAPLARLLPTLRIDSTDPAAADILGLAVITDPDKRAEALAALTHAGKTAKSVEAKLRRADALIQLGAFDPARAEAEAVLGANEFEWRAHWYAGKAHLAESNARAVDGEPKAATRAAELALDRFDRVYFEMPGELAPKLAIAFAAEAAGDFSRAAALYRLVAAIDPAHASADFGLGRCMMRLGDEGASADALEAVPLSHALYTESRIALARVLIEADHRPDASFIARAAAALALVGKGHAVGHQLAGRLLAKAGSLLGAGTTRPNKTATLLGHAMTPRALQGGAEIEYLEAARLSGSARERAVWVDQADVVRPVTLF